jgi:predicted kinase
MLIVLGGLPGAGKTTLAAALARALGAVHVRIDTLEQAIRDSAAWQDGRSIDDAGYRAGYALAEDNLRLGHVVIADSVNPWPVTRDAWADVARRAGVPVVEVEIVCSDRAEHRRRVESRRADIPGLTLPTWAEVSGRDYRPWDRDRVVIDTAVTTAERAVEAIRARLPRTP